MARAAMWGGIIGLGAWAVLRIFGAQVATAPHLVDSPFTLTAGGAFWFAVVYALRRGVRSLRK